MFTTNGVKSQDQPFVSSFATYGINNFKINSIDVAEGGRPDVYKIFFNMETPPIEDPAFKPAKDTEAEGQICNVKVYLTLEASDQGKSITQLMATVGTIADKLGIKAEVDAIKESDLAIYFKKFMELVKGKFAWYKITGYEWDTNKFSLGFARYRFCKSLTEVQVDKAEYSTVRGKRIMTSLPSNTGAMVWDENVSYDFKPFVAPKPSNDFTLNPVVPGEKDLPFDAAEDGETRSSSFLDE